MDGPRGGRCVKKGKVGRVKTRVKEINNAIGRHRRQMGKQSKKRQDLIRK